MRPRRAVDLRSGLGSDPLWSARPQYGAGDAARRRRQTTGVRGHVWMSDPAREPDSAQPPAPYFTVLIFGLPVTPCVAVCTTFLASIAASVTVVLDDSPATTYTVPVSFTSPTVAAFFA